MIRALQIRKCECGCGEETRLYRGAYRRFLRGHHMRRKEMRTMHSNRMKGNKLFARKTHTKEARKSISTHQKGKNNSVWKGGRTLREGGYVSILCRDHPFADVNGRVKEERLVMEKHLGRYLTKKEVVHHKNKIKHDNRLKNLVVMTRTEHRILHNNEQKGRKCSESSKKRMSEGQKKRGPRKPHTEEARRNMSESQKGRKASDETKRKISEGNRKREVSDKTKKKMSQIHKQIWAERKRNAKNHKNI